MYSESLFNTLYIELEKFPSDKINVKKLLSFFYRELRLITALLCNSYMS